MFILGCFNGVYTLISVHSLPTVKQSDLPAFGKSNLTLQLHWLDH